MVLVRGEDFIKVRLTGGRATGERLRSRDFAGRIGGELD
jgi:hypothetical protein